MSSADSTTGLSVNGATAVLSISITIVDQIPNNGLIVIQLPK